MALILSPPYKEEERTGEEEEMGRIVYFKYKQLIIIQKKCQIPIKISKYFKVGWS